jgi:hypothetical protein
MLTVKRGDTYPITFTANMDLTGATVRLLARSSQGNTIELASTIQDAVAGTVVHNLTGTLGIDVYEIELEVTHTGTIISFPSDGFEQLCVIPDLG